MYRPRPRPRRTRGRLRPRTPPSRTPRHLTCRVSVSVLLVVTWTSSDALPPAKPDPVGGARPPRCCHDVFVADDAAVCGPPGWWLIAGAENHGRSVKKPGDIWSAGLRPPRAVGSLCG